MDLNDIQLNGSMLAGLYPHSLVEMEGAIPAAVSPQPAPRPAPAPPAPTAAAASGPAFLGQNGRGILVVTADPEARFVGDADLAFLTNVLGACNLGLADVAILNWRGLPDADGAALTNTLNARQVLLFEVMPDTFGLPVNFPAFQVQNLAGRTYVHAPALSAIAADKELKKALWMALKKMFEV